MLEYINSPSHSRKATIIKKITNRSKRKEEITKDVVNDLSFVSDAEFQSHKKDSGFLNYQFDKHQYGFHKEVLDEALKKHDNVFIIVRNLSLLEDLEKHYPDIRIVSVFIYSDKIQITQRLKREGYDKQAIDFRVGRFEQHWATYLKHSSFYDEIIINNGTKSDFHRQIEDIIKYYGTQASDRLFISKKEQYELMKSLTGHKDKILAMIDEYPFEKNVFLMMKFRDSNVEIKEYITKYLGLHGFHCVRADDWNLTDDVYNPIAVLYCCKYGIAVFDEPEDGNVFSPNVAYELGIMHYQKKECLILKHKSLPPMPFDLIKNMRTEYDTPKDTVRAVLTWVKSLSKIGR